MTDIFVTIRKFSKKKEFLNKTRKKVFLSKTVVRRILDAEAEGKFNVAFLSNMLTGNLSGCLNLLLTANRLPEAAMFCRTYLPSEISRVTKLWKGSSLHIF